LEESLLEFRGSLVLVTHDRYMLDRVSTIVLGLDGQGGAERFADYSQWEIWQAERQQSSQAGARATARTDATDSAASSSATAKKKLSYLEAREYASIEQRVADAEQVMEAKRSAAEDPAIASDSARLMKAHAELEEAQNEVNELYARWAELEKKQQA
jgi:ATP-binding cassette subfamily F protein uup